MMVEAPRRFTQDALPLGYAPGAGNGRLLSPLGQARLVYAATGVLASIEGLSAVPPLEAIIARRLGADALRLRRELERNGMILPRGEGE